MSAKINWQFELEEYSKEGASGQIEKVKYGKQPSIYRQWMVQKHLPIFWIQPKNIAREKLKKTN